MGILLFFTMLSAALLLLASACDKSTGTHGPLNTQEKHGEKLFVANCQKCHQPDNGLATQGPQLEGIFNKQFLPSGEPANDDRVQSVIQYGRRSMPAFGPVMDDTQIKDIIAFLHKQ